MGKDNSGLLSVQDKKSEEYYTRYYDIECEMNAYIEHNRDVFRGKTILLPCNDPEWSNFTRYFAANFTKFGLKKIIAVSYAKEEGNKLTPLEQKSPLYDETKHDSHGRLYMVVGDANRDGIIDTDDIIFCGYLEGDGDFRSEEVTKLRDEADVIVTTPPFSLFSKFLAWLFEANKEFIILGSQNFIGYRHTFPLLKSGDLWLGYTSFKNMLFEITDEHKQYLINHKKEGINYIVEDGATLGIASTCWFTNIEHYPRNNNFIFDTLEHNLVFNKKLHKKLENEYGKIEYPRYINYDAIEVPFTECIPCDYEPAMSIPIYFIYGWSAEQFEIIGDTFADVRPEFLPTNENYNNKLCVREREGAAQVLALGRSKEEMTEILASMGVPENEMSWINGEMGVPLTFMDKYNPEMFEILGSSFELARPITLPNGKPAVDNFYVWQRNKLQAIFTRIVIRWRR